MCRSAAESRGIVGVGPPMTWAAGAVLCVLLAPPAAQASPPLYDPVREVCVTEGMLLGRYGYMDVPFPDQVDWSKFEGRVVRFKMHSGPLPARLIIPPVAIGVCDPAMVAASLPRALAQRAEYELLSQKDPDMALADIERAVRLVPTDCDFAAGYVFILERIGRRKEADAAAAQAETLSCAPRYREHLRWLRQGSVIKLF